MAWDEIPSTYNVCETDNAITPAIAQASVTSCRIPCEVLRMDSSHRPALSMPDRLPAVIRRTAGEKDVDLQHVKSGFSDGSSGKLEWFERF